MNGPPPGKAEAVAAEDAVEKDESAQSAAEPSATVEDGSIEVISGVQQSETSEGVAEEKIIAPEPDAVGPAQGLTDVTPAAPIDQETAKLADQEDTITGQQDAELSSQLETLQVAESAPQEVEAEPVMIDSAQQSAESQNEFDSDSGSDSDDGGWITPSNLKKKQAADATGSTKEAEAPAVMQVAVITTDFAMQNVILQMNLNLLSSAMFRVKRLNTYVLRCHACFNVCRDLAKQFCPRCGQATLTRVACSTSASGEFRLHLKKNMQWNHRGDRYSIPKPVHGSSNGKLKGGGKGGWGNELMLAEDQKEYQNAARVQQRQKTRNLMDEDYLPGILTGDRGKSGGRIKVGAGRNVNSKKR
jgi:RNA-binding protein NOB1